MQVSFLYNGELTIWSKPFLWSSFLYFMELGVLLVCSHELAFGPYPEPYESSLQSSISVFKISFNNIILSTPGAAKICIFQDFIPKLYKQFCPLPHLSHTTHIWFFFIWLF